MDFVKIAVGILLIVFLIVGGLWHVNYPQPERLDHRISLANQAVTFQLEKIKAERDTYSKAVHVQSLLPLAESGNLLAQLYVGKFYYQNDANDQEMARAIRYLKNGAEFGLPVAQNAYGTAFIEGRGVKKDPVEGYKWILLASERGYDLAQQNLLSVSRRLPSKSVYAAEKRAAKWRENYLSDSHRFTAE